MERIQIRKTELQVSRLCFGGCPMGGYGWGDVSRQELIDAVHEALDFGVNFFDTADTYGIGEAEETLREALQGRRDQAVINTKFGVRGAAGGKTYYDNSPEWITQALDASLRRLGTDYVDMYQIHYRDGKTPLSAVVEVLENLKCTGKIRSYGLSNIHDGDRDELRSVRQFFCSFQNEYSLAKRENEKEISSLGDEFSMTPMTWGSLGQGILTGKYDAHTRFAGDDRRSRAIYDNFHGESLVRNLRIVDELRAISEAHGVSIASVAIRWILDRLPGSVVIAGIKRPQQLQANMEAMGWNLTRKEMDRLDGISANDV